MTNNNNILKQHESVGVFFRGERKEKYKIHTLLISTGEQHTAVSSTVRTQKIILQ
jgi:hypothetical protein